jgi:peptide deformylase
MALREICVLGEDILRKKSRTVERIDDRIRQLAGDMAETMYKANGVGLAAPQVGILKRIIVVDVGEGLVTLINPEILEAKGSQSDEEGCLSIPGKRGTVERPMEVIVKGLDEQGNVKEIKAEGYFARALCHEIDHLSGTLFIDKMEKEVQLP